MLRTHFFQRLLLGTIASCAAILSVCSTATADEPLRWKFRAGERLKYDMTQEMTMNINAGPAGQMVTTVQQTINMVWNVLEVNEQGDAVIRLTIDRAKMNMAAPMGQSFEYDSGSEEPAEGMAAMVAPMYEAMTKGLFEITMTPRGELRDVKVPAEVLNALKNSPGAAAMGDLATAEGFQKMILQGAVVFPEETPAVGEAWSNTTTINNPMTGKQTVETSYQYEGTRDVDGVTMAVFRPSVKMEFEGNQAMPMKVIEQQTDGEVLFNLEAGRLDSTTLKQMTKMDMTIAGQTFQQQIDQLIEVNVSPVDAAEEVTVAE